MTAKPTPTTFTLTGPLPTGTWVIDASAGTGKTYAIVSLATRFVAEQDIPLSQLMLVTFGRAATQELRERARERFTTCAAALADPAAARGSDDAVIAHLATGADAEVLQRQRRLLRALSEFDAATIVTTHAFCQRMLDGIGVAGDFQPDAAFRENVADLVGQVSDDRYIADYSAMLAPSLTTRDARAIAKAATDDPQALLVPTDAPAGTAADRVAFAQAARVELTRRKRMLAVRDFNDLLVLLRDALADPAYGPTARERIRSRYRVVLADEFQDTDPLQWDILRSAFHGAVTLILVGDPKQAIYAFRGADVMTYLDAVAVAGDTVELAVNRRSDAGLLRGLHRLYGGAALGPDQIVVHPVAAAHEEPRIPGGAPLRLRYLTRAVFGDGSKTPGVDVVRRRIADDVAHDIVTTLTTGQHILDGDLRRPLAPSDIAVLVRNRDQGSLVRDALTRAAVPCVLTGGASVFTTAAATAWQRILAALEQPHRPGWVRLAALTPLLGYTAEDLAVGGDALVATLSAQLRGWSEVFDRLGVAAMFELIAASRALDARLVAVEGGERTLTDLRHLAQLMNQAVTSEQLGLASLSAWLVHRAAEEQNTATSDRSRLLDRESAAVRVVTIHTSKGREFPIVYLPYCWDAPSRDKPVSLLLHENGRRVRDVGGKNGPGYDQRLAEHQLEDAGEELRVLYVAATRAQSRVVAWWAPTVNTPAAALHRLLFGRVDGQPQPAAKPVVAQDQLLAGKFAQWADPVGDVVTIEALPGPQEVAVLPPETRTGGRLEVAAFTRALDWSWQRVSYTRLTKAGHDAAAGTLSETEEVSIVDEPEGPGVNGAGAVGETPSLMNDFRGGTAFGDLVHKVLQRVDTSADDLAAEVRARTGEVVATRLAAVDPDGLAAEVRARTGEVVATRLAAVDPDGLATALTAVLNTPIPGGTLAAVATRDRLTELEFELPLAGGDDPVGAPARLGAIAGLIDTHLARDDPLAGYSTALRMIPDATLLGYLTGSIDAVLRLPGPRFVIVDYKTNKLFAGAVDAAQFDQAAMAQEMLRWHYPLQALLYSVALHRYLRWRQPGYRPEAHLGGVQYLFVRAMVGQRTPPGCGVFAWYPPPGLVVALSDLLAAR